MLGRRLRVGATWLRGAAGRFLAARGKGSAASPRHVLVLILALHTLGLPPAPATESTPSPYRVQPADVLEISFFDRPELNQVRTVGPDGQIYLPLVGAVQVTGRTVDDLNRELTARYGEEMVEPQITLSVQKFAGMNIYVGGEVNRGGMMPYRGGLTLVQAIMEAGGFMKTGKMKTVILIRKGEEAKPEPQIVDVRSIINAGEFERDIALHPSDIVFVPRKTISNVNMWFEQYLQNNWPLPFSLGFNITPSN